MVICHPKRTGRTKRDPPRIGQIRIGMVGQAWNIRYEIALDEAVGTAGQHIPTARGKCEDSKDCQQQDSSILNFHGFSSSEIWLWFLYSTHRKPPAPFPADF